MQTIDQEYENNYAVRPMMANPYSNAADMIDAGTSKWELENDDILTEIEHFLRGEVYDSRSKNFVKIRKALINEDGINAVMTILYSHLTKNFTLSNFDEKQVCDMAREVSHLILRTLYCNHLEFDADISSSQIVVDIIDHNVFATLRRAFNQGEKVYRRTIMRMMEQFKGGEQKERKSLFSGFKLFSRREEQPAQTVYQ